MSVNLISVYSVLAQLRDGRISVVASDFPSFLFDKYNPDDIDEGLLKGYLLVRVSSRSVLYLFHLILCHRCIDTFLPRLLQLCLSHQAWSRKLVLTTRHCQS
jgi:hypothetical protein